MNGCDHQPLQLDLPEAIRTAEKLYPDTKFVHSTLPDYLQALEGALGGRELSTVKGELRSQRTDGWGTLVNTASSRVYLKQMNQEGQTLLEKSPSRSLRWRICWAKTTRIICSPMLGKR
ncbi:hypothetical protein HMSSN036_13000 [Paenibacillus macerans]|nr:hypothetical protein HMSSN036_13000 [Paenibacillus macerans]